MSIVSLIINNNSGKDLVIAFVQGGLPGQTVDQLKWGEFVYAMTTNASVNWKVPNNPTSNADLAPFMLEIASGSNAMVSIPSYSELVGFRCLVAETDYKTDALQELGNVKYMAFPNLMTANYVFDKFEAGLTENTPGIWNITSVDFLAIPMQLTKGDVTVGYKEGVTGEGMNQILAALDAPYNTGGSIAPNTASDTYRFFSPQHISGANTCLDSAITNDLPLLFGNTSVVKYGTDEFSDFKDISVSGSPAIGSITCTSKLNGTITLMDVSTEKAFAGKIGLNGNGSEKVFGALIAAALCRGVLGTPEKWGDIKYPNSQCATPWNYYPTGKIYDEYSKIIHDYSIEGKNYGFSYDDYFSDEAGFNVIGGESVSLNILPISGNMTATANGTPTVKTGCLSIGIPDPTSQVSRMGHMSCNGQEIDSKSNVLCFLDDKIIIKFTDYPTQYNQPEIHIDLTKDTQGDAVSYWENGVKSSTLSVIGLVYFPDQRQLTFGETSAWQS